jgi:hypothetical protein
MLSLHFLEGGFTLLRALFANQNLANRRGIPQFTATSLNAFVVQRRSDSFPVAADSVKTAHVVQNVLLALVTAIRQTAFTATLFCLLALTSGA